DISYTSKNPATFEADLTKAIASGSGPDLILISQEDLATLTGEINPISYKTLSQRKFMNTFSDGSAIYLRSNGIYGLPVTIDPLVLYYNQTILASSGIVGEASTTWEMLTGWAPRVVKLTKTHNISRALISLGTYSNVHNARGVLSTLFLQAGVPIVTLNKRGGYKISLNTANGASSPGESVLRFYTQFADPTKVSYTWNTTLPDSQQMFIHGDSALYLGYASEASFVAEANPNLSFDIAQVPQLQTASFKTDYAKIYAFSVPRGSRNVYGALKVASLFINPANDRLVAKSSGTAPALRSLLEAAPNDPVSAVVYPAAIMSRTWLSPTPTMTDNIFSRMIKDVVTGKTSIAQALTNAEQLIRSALPGIKTKKPT
ncbi:MAG TPA: extracellular solute-binding protein, partial [Candidatus Kaiserbacteria bacterium]|nr:extracellular solute-binding protein [Candidatus Kaiserbacteria bacterium]